MMQLMQKEVPFGYFKKFKQNKMDAHTYSDSHPLILGLQGLNGSCDHAVVLCDGWIFDGAHEVAMELCRENLDVCCRFR